MTSRLCHIACFACGRIENRTFIQNLRVTLLAPIRRIIERTWLAAFVILALVFLFLYFKDNRDAVVALLQADVRLLLAAAVAQVLYFFTTVVTWQKALLYSTGRSVGLWEGLTQILLVNFGKYIPGKVWGLAARGARLKELGYGLDEIGSVSYLEQFLLILTGFWLAFLAAVFAFQEPLYLLPWLLVTIVIVLFKHGSKLAKELVRAIPKAGWLERLVEIRISTAEVIGLAAGYVVVWLFLTLTFVLVCNSLLSIELTIVNLAIFLLSLTAGFLAGFVALFAPGGVGVREGVGAVFLSSMMTLEEALLLMLLFRVWVVLAELAAGSTLLAKRFQSSHVEKS